jgi:hypothetical protein
MHGQFYLENLKTKKSLGKSRCSWDDNTIKIIFMERGFEDVDWSHLA